MNRLFQLGREILQEAFNINKQLGSKGNDQVQTDKDIVLEADLAVNIGVRELVSKKNISTILWTEEKEGKIITGENPSCTIAFDDIDGTFNKHDGLGVLPYCSIVTIFDTPTPCYNDAVYAGIQVHNNGDLIEAIRERGVFRNGVKIQLNPSNRLERDSRVYINHYETSRSHPEELQRLVGLEARTIPRDVLSSGIAFAMVACHGSAYISGKNKAHELGAGYLLMRESGGTILDFNGNDIGTEHYGFNDSKSMIAAVNLEIACEILEEIGRQTP